MVSQEVVTSGTVFEHNEADSMGDSISKGTLRWGTWMEMVTLEIISAFNGVVTVLDRHGQLVWTVSNGGRSGPPTVADFDGDGFAEVGVASKLEYTVYDSDGSVLWAQPTQETSSGMTGSAVLDFEGWRSRGRIL